MTRQALRAACPTHPRAAVLGLCGRCDVFVCKRDGVDVEGRLFCTRCAAAPATLPVGKRARGSPERGGRPLASRRWRTFIDARAFVHTLGLRNVTDWRNYRAGAFRELPPCPSDIPGGPDGVYGRMGSWTSWGDFLGTGAVASRLLTWRTFARARAFVRGLGLRNFTEWRAYRRGERPDLGAPPDDIPSGPTRSYATEWRGWGDFLGTGVLSKRRPYRAFKAARAFARSLGLPTRDAWSAYAQGERPDLGQLPADVPTCPWVTYKKQWKGIGDWLGTGSLAPKDRVFRPFREARAWARSLGLRTWKDWRCQTRRDARLPETIPAAPWRVYPGSGAACGTGSGSSATTDKLRYVAL
jgi:hypothetical protein